jgi:hypothetical protein
VEQLRLIASDAKVETVVHLKIQITYFSLLCWTLSLVKLWNNWRQQNADLRPVY